MEQIPTHVCRAAQVAIFETLELPNEQTNLLSLYEETSLTHGDKRLPTYLPAATDRLDVVNLMST